MGYLSAVAGDQGGDYDRDPDKNRYVGVAGEEREDLWSIDGAEEGKERVANEAADGYCSQEFGKRILHGAGGDHEGNQRKWRGKQRGDKDRGETPALKRFQNFIDSLF